MVRQQLLTILLSCCFMAASAQVHDLVSASGASLKNSSGSISYSIGEPVIGTLNSSTLILTQGFHQTKWSPDVPVIQQSAIRVSVFPNPVKDLLTLQIGDPQGFEYLLYDIKGALLNRAEVLGELTQIDFSKLRPAIYVLKVTNQKAEFRLFQIVKY